MVFLYQRFRVGLAFTTGAILADLAALLFLITLHPSSLLTRKGP